MQFHNLGSHLLLFVYVRSQELPCHRGPLGCVAPLAEPLTAPPCPRAVQHRVGAIDSRKQCNPAVRKALGRRTLPRAQPTASTRAPPLERAPEAAR